MQSIIFTVLYLGLQPRLATERMDAGELRLQKIRQLIAESRWSIHDLSRCVAKTAGEHFRLNMPFELGIDFGCRHFAGGRWEGKRFLILEEQRYRYQAALSDMAGADIQVHEGNPQIAMREVRDWLRLAARVDAPGAARITAAYLVWQEWHWHTMLARGHSEADIRRYPTFEVLDSIREWLPVHRAA